MNKRYTILLILVCIACAAPAALPVVTPTAQAKRVATYESRQMSVIVTSTATPRLLVIGNETWYCRAGAGMGYAAVTVLRNETVTVYAVDGDWYFVGVRRDGIVSCWTRYAQ